ncbi:PDR/VanB family oxidoreductase [Raineyella sp. LH-20]|uniref:PDR/VanB family oxidoreductase n=1 Tax=Raineyella sp. LH-20 TaxID=3081204 RepID=UPI0029534C13|nr:PDR/VanB family oxidoreductase [Raineyella sp. LH-20]WOP19286.1 PDR/VanB family oxidoreductase [Raineyella sp. LH-20]
MALIDVRVAEIIDETPTIRSFRLVRIDGRPLGTYQAGAHVDVVGPTAITRQYSLCSTPEDPDAYTVAVKREEHSRGGSAALHALQVGDVIRISEPRNLLGIDADAEHHILVAAGIGITPMLSMARYLDLHGQDFALHYFARSHEEAAFLGLLEEKCPQKLHAHLGVPRAGHEPILRAALADAPGGSHVYLCGPEGFMDTVVRVAGESFPEERIHREAFTAAEQPDPDGDRPFEVELEGATYAVPAGRSIVEVLQEAGCDVDTSCQEGICGTCIMTVLDGTPEHRDNVLTRAEKAANATIAVCVSRAQGDRLVLDYF